MVWGSFGPKCSDFGLLRAPKRWGPPRWQGLCSHPAHLWATSDFIPRSEALGFPQAAGLGLNELLGFTFALFARTHSYVCVCVREQP